MGQSYRQRKAEIEMLTATIERLNGLREGERRDFAERLSALSAQWHRLRTASFVSLVKWRFFGGVLLLALLAAPSTAAAQPCADDIDIRHTRVWNSPGDLMSWPCTASVTSVLFTASGFPVDFDKRDGPNRWTDQRTPGWDGDLQYTLGMCLFSRNGDGWDCSAVVQFWNGRQRNDPNATAAPYAVDKEWFYDPNRWGPLYSRNPLPNEGVGIFVCRGDCRANTPQTRERSAVVLVQWDKPWSGVAKQQSGGGSSEDTSAKTGGEAGGGKASDATPGEPVDLSGVAKYDQVERVLADLAARTDALARQLAAHDEHLTQHDTSPGWLKKFLTSPAGLLITGAASACASTQCWAHLGGK